MYYLPSDKTSKILLDTLENNNYSNWESLRLTVNCDCESEYICGCCYEIKTKEKLTKEQKQFKDMFYLFNSIRIRSSFGDDILGRIVKSYVYLLGCPK